MSVPFWKPGTEYTPDELVQANNVGEIVQVALTNGDFELGSQDWALGTGVTIDGGDPFAGSFAMTAVPAGALGFPAATTATNADRRAVIVGQIVRVRCQARTVSKTSTALIGISYYNSGGSLISTTYGDGTAFGDTNFREIRAEAVAPADAVTVSVTCRAETTSVSNPTSLDASYFDNIVWDYYTQPALGVVIFKAVQAAPAFSDSSEPVWPTVVSNQVVDGGVTWEAVAANVIVWKAVPIMKSSTPEPTFPTSVGATVLDGSVIWVAESLRIEDENCPNTKSVAIAASKVFAVDDDIIAFSATVNPLDWTTVDDAGYIPFGLNTYGSEPLTALGLYRSNLVGFNSLGFQMWQVDEDPANMAILDAVPVGCRYYKSVSPVSNDLVFLTDAGIRSMGIAGASTNLQAGTFGKQIDPLILEAMANVSDEDDIVSLYNPGTGQYWLIFDEEAFVLTMNGGPKDLSWSRYVFPSAITDWTIDGSDLILRSGNKIWRFDPDVLVDDFGDANVAFEGEVWWPYLDFGALGQTKMMLGFDTVATGEYDVVFGYNQNDDTHVTTSYTITDGDTVVGDIIPMPISAPSFQMRLTFTGNTAWKWSATTLYLQDWRRTS